MIRKSIKYLKIAGVNLVILTGLLAFWTDTVELSFNNWVRPIEFLKIIGFTLLSLIGMRIALESFRKRNTSIKKRIQISAVLTFLISIFLYTNYSKNFYKNRIQNREIRMELAAKIKPANALSFGTKADNLTFNEYKEITKINWFPKLQNRADSISYFYTYDGVLPDYTFELSFNLPNQVETDLREFQYGKIEIDSAESVNRINYLEHSD